MEEARQTALEVAKEEDAKTEAPGTHAAMTPAEDHPGHTAPAPRTNSWP